MTDFSQFIEEDNNNIDRIWEIKKKLSSVTYILNIHLSEN